MLLRSTIFALGLALATTVHAQLQQPKSLNVSQQRTVVSKQASVAPRPKAALSTLRETAASPAARPIRPVIFQDAEAPGPIAAPGFAEEVPQAPEAGTKKFGACSSCGCNTGCGCGRGLRARIRRHHMYYFGYDPEAWVRPFGDATLDHLEKQVANGVAARMTLHGYDFMPAGKDKAKLNPAGWRQLTKIADLAQRSEFPIVIESTPHNKAAEKLRRQAVLDALQAMGSDIAADRVVVAEPAARGLSGEEALIIYDNLLQQTQSRGTVVNSGSFTTGGAGSADAPTVTLE